LVPDRQRVVGGIKDMSCDEALAQVEKEINLGLKGGGSDAHYIVNQARKDYIAHKEALGGERAAATAPPRTLKAALNYAKARKIVGSDDAWTDIKAHKAKDGQRDVYLNLRQRQLLLGACDDEPKNFLLAMLHTAARPSDQISSRSWHYSMWFESSTASFGPKAVLRLIKMLARK
jgi:hypothetical protein